MCKNCARVITWRKKWESNWDSIVYCSATCRRPLGDLDRAFEKGILELLSWKRQEAVGRRKWEEEWVTCEEVEEIVMREWKEGGAKREEEVLDRSSESLSLEDEEGSIDGPPSSAGTEGMRSNPTHIRERVRKAARRLTEEKIIKIWQLGKIVDPSFAKGIMELRGVEGLAVDLIMVREKMIQKVCSNLAYILYVWYSRQCFQARLKVEGGTSEDEGRKGKGRKGKKGKKGDWDELENELDDVDEGKSRSNGKVKGSRKLKK